MTDKVRHRNPLVKKGRIGVMTERKYRDEEWLREQYEDRGRSMADIGEECGTSGPTIRDWLIRFDIEIRTRAGTYEKSMEERFWSKVDVGDDDECWEWNAHRGSDGYGRFSVDSVMRTAHRVAFYLDRGHWPEHCALHHCDNPPCVNPNHLYDGDQSDNNLDAYERGRREYPQYDRPRKLSDDDVADIHRRAEAGERGIQQELAEEYGVSDSVVSMIANEKYR